MFIFIFLASLFANIFLWEDGIKSFLISLLLWSLFANSSRTVREHFFKTSQDKSGQIRTSQNLSWLVLSCPDLSWLVLTCPDLSWRVLTIFGFFWLILTCTDLSWLVLTCLVNILREDGIKSCSLSLLLWNRFANSLRTVREHFCKNQITLFHVHLYLSRKFVREHFSLGRWNKIFFYFSPSLKSVREQFTNSSRTLFQDKSGQVRTN